MTGARLTTSTHTDPAFSWGLSLSLAQAGALAAAATEGPDTDALIDRYFAAVTPEARERHALACTIDDERTRRWAGETLDVGHHDGAYGLFSLFTALAAATRRAKIGFAVIQTSLHHPVRLAEQLSLLDHISRGRLVIGLGRGTAYNIYDYQGYGFDHEEAQARAGS